MPKEPIEKNLEKMNEEYLKSRRKAEKLIKDRENMVNTLKKAVKKSKGLKGPLEKVWEYLQLIFSMISDWIRGEYREVPIGTVITLAAAILYFLSPIDIIPDFIPGIGYIDDVFVISLAVAQTSADLEKYKLWKEKSNNEISES